jgi:hypothetical protein
VVTTRKTKQQCAGRQTETIESMKRRERRKRKDRK